MGLQMDILFKFLKALYIILCCVVSIELAVIIHELGHLLMGKLIGYKVGYYRIGSFAFVKLDGKWKYTRCDGAIGTRGQCIMIPPENDHPEKVPAVLYHLGGGIFNLLTAAISILLFLSVHILFLRQFLILLACVSIALAILNLVPMTISVPNDGYNALRAMKCEADKVAMYRILRINGISDLTPSEMPPELYEYSEEGEYSRVSKMLRSYYHLDRKEFEEAEKLLSECAVKDSKSITYYRLESSSELLFCKLIRHASKQEIDDLFDAELKDYFEKTKKTSARVHRIMYAYDRLYMKDEKAASEDYDQAVKLQNKNAFRGDARMESNLLDYVSKLDVPD